MHCIIRLHTPAMNARQGSTPPGRLLENQVARTSKEKGWTLLWRTLEYLQADWGQRSPADARDPADGSIMNLRGHDFKKQCSQQRRRLMDVQFIRSHRLAQESMSV